MVNIQRNYRGTALSRTDVNTEQNAERAKALERIRRLQSLNNGIPQTDQDDQRRDSEHDRQWRQTNGTETHSCSTTRGIISGVTSHRQPRGTQGPNPPKTAEVVRKVKYTDIAVRCPTCLTATGTHMPYWITQCYLPPSRGDIPAFTPAEAGTRLMWW